MCITKFTSYHCRVSKQGSAKPASDLLNPRTAHVGTHDPLNTLRIGHVPSPSYLGTSNPFPWSSCRNFQITLNADVMVTQPIRVKGEACQLAPGPYWIVGEYIHCQLATGLANWRLNRLFKSTATYQAN